MKPTNFQVSLHRAIRFMELAVVISVFLYLAALQLEPRSQSPADGSTVVAMEAH